MHRGMGSMVALVACAGLALQACADDANDGGGPDPTVPTSVPGTTPPQTAPPGTTEPGEALAIVTFEVAGDETFKVELVSEGLVEHAERLLAGEDLSSIPLGTVVRDDPGPNAPWSWHLDPATFEFAFVTTEVCDGIPSFVEDATVTSDQYCPWSAEVIAVDRT